MSVPTAASRRERLVPWIGVLLACTPGADRRSLAASTPGNAAASAQQSGAGAPGRQSTATTPTGSGMAAASAPPAAMASPHPAVARLVARFATAAGGRPATEGHPSEAVCRELTGFRGGELDRCTLVLHANGTAAEVALSYDCGDHLCSTETYVWYGDDPEPYHLEDNAMPVEVSPDHRYLLYTELQRGGFTSAPTRGRTLRLERKSGKTEPFLDCFSVVLSPSGRYYVCRDLDANVLRVPVAGGRPELVVRAELPSGESIKLGGPFDDYPAPVTFPRPGEVQYELFLNESGKVLERRAPYRE